MCKPCLEAISLAECIDRTRGYLLLRLLSLQSCLPLYEDVKVAQEGIEVERGIFGIEEKYNMINFVECDDFGKVP